MGGINVGLDSDIAVRRARIGAAILRGAFVFLHNRTTTLRLKFKPFEDLGRRDLPHAGRSRAGAIRVHLVKQIAVSALLNEEVSGARQVVMKHAHKGAEHLTGDVEVDLLIVLKGDEIFRCEDLVDELVDLFLVCLAALEGYLAGVVEAFAALAVV